MVSDCPVNAVRGGHQLLGEGQHISNGSTAGFSWRYPQTHRCRGMSAPCNVHQGRRVHPAAGGQRGPQGHATAGRDSKAGRGAGLWGQRSQSVLGLLFPREDWVSCDSAYCYYYKFCLKERQWADPLVLGSWGRRVCELSKVGRARWAPGSGILFSQRCSLLAVS